SPATGRSSPVPASVLGSVTAPAARLRAPVVSALVAVTVRAAGLLGAVHSRIHNVVHWYPTGGHLYCGPPEVRRDVRAGGWTVSREARTTGHRWSLLLTCPSTSRPDRRSSAPAKPTNSLTPL